MASVIVCHVLAMQRMDTIVTHEYHYPSTLMMTEGYNVLNKDIILYSQHTYNYNSKICRVDAKI